MSALPQYGKTQTLADAQNIDFEKKYIVAEEKVDGANMRFACEGVLDHEYHSFDRGLAFGNRRTVWKNKRDESNAFADAINTVRSCVNVADVEYVERVYGSGEPFVFFGENLTPHTLEYDFDSAPDFIGFDVYDAGVDEFLPVDTVREIYNKLGLPVPQLQVVSEYGETLDESMVPVPQSEYGDVQAEGVVLKSMDGSVRLKHVRESFKEVLMKPNDKPESDAAYIVNKYLTDARIEKQAHKLVDRGCANEVTHALLAPTDEHDGLVTEVIRDMMEEAGTKIVMEEDVEVSTEALRSEASDKVSSVLKEM